MSPPLPTAPPVEFDIRQYTAASKYNPTWGALWHTVDIDPARLRRDCANIPVRMQASWPSRTPEWGCWVVPEQRLGLKPVTRRRKTQDRETERIRHLGLPLIVTQSSGKLILPPGLSTVIG